METSVQDYLEKYYHERQSSSTSFEYSDTGRLSELLDSWKESSPVTARVPTDAYLKTMIDSLNSELKTAHGTIHSLRTSLASQTRRVEALEAEKAERLVQHQREKHELQTRVAGFERDLAQLQQHITDEVRILRSENAALKTKRKKKPKKKTPQTKQGRKLGDITHLIVSLEKRQADRRQAYLELLSDDGASAKQIDDLYQAIHENEARLDDARRIQEHLIQLYLS